MALNKESALRKDETSGLSEMQHRHFATVAAIIKSLDLHNASRSGSDQLRYAVAKQFADNLARTNPRFDRARFMRACDVED